MPQLTEPRAKKLRLSVPFSTELYKAIEIESKGLGVSMSSMVAFIVGNYIASKNTLLNNLNDALSEQLQKAIDQKKWL